MKARIYDRNEAKQVEIEVESDEEGTADYTLPEPFADEGEAKKAAGAKAKHLKSETITTSVTLFGDPSIRAGAPFPYSGVRPEVDAIEFIIETATHTLSKAGYTTEVEAKLKPEAGSGGGKAQGAGTGGAGSAANGSGEDNAGGGSTPPTAAPVPTIPAPGGIGSQ